MKAYFIDLDGVLIDSIDECWLVATKAYFGFVHSSPLIKNFFYKHRGLVGPPYQYFTLLDLTMNITEDLRGLTDDEISVQFKKLIKGYSQKTKLEIEKNFFETREKFKKDMEYWLSLHKLTEYGECLQKKSLENYFLITTKDKSSTDTLVSHFGLAFDEVYCNEEINEKGSKAAIIDSILENSKQFTSAVFVDDSVDHLELVNNKSVNCYFADWGYGNRQSFEIFDKSLW